ncbi:hypothetical protein GUITHDRAFT_114865 [Guillardia theta CCMP2712]|uniref:FAD/NAD(P)-binding domain-containing protein n=1 Tax=Guillardia theta (strain CCMP2712) TaxID=905079 RepID=L1IT20_GUITC|nr:hypothetical protein GUITHDRAFT_114865 [Guillardia theta CCMP2712]EKX38985.1 hypothetical protein GUITHDRAFT_114865 [Guillardia theta CCMP2712]|eukprot:XP_005825965.1 hypothetical protein GUITHDRAFT_114865 [Guillardia theta CCMP2712]
MEASRPLAAHLSSPSSLSKLQHALQRSRVCWLRPAGLRFMSSGQGEADKKRLHYDLCVIGAGPGGWAGAVRGWDLGKKTCVIESRGGLGGVAVWGGAIGGKVMLEVGKGLRRARPHLKGEAAATADGGVWAEVRRRTRLAMLERATQLDQQLISLGQTRRFNRPTLKRAEKSGTIQKWKGDARFLSPNEVSVGENLVIEANHFLVATGSIPIPLPKFPADGEYIVTTQQLLKSAETIPQSVIILGGTVLGCETATLLASLGTPKIHVINSEAALFPDDDADIAAFAMDSLERDGVHVHHQSYLEFAKIHPEEKLIECRIVHTRWSQNVEAGGHAVPHRHHQPHKHRGSRSAEHVYFAGDILGKLGLSAVAEMQGRYAVEHMFSQQYAVKPSYDGLCTVMHINPEVAFVGMCEEEARRRDLPHIVAKIVLENCASGLIKKYSTFLPSVEYGEKVEDPFEVPESSLGFVKIVVLNDESQRLLGVRCAGEGARSVIQAAAILIESRQHVRALARSSHPFPSILEALQECVRMVLGTSIHKHHLIPDNTTYIRTYVPSGKMFYEGSEDEHVDRPTVPTYLR